VKQYVESARSEPARQTKLARAAAFNHIAAEKSFAIDFSSQQQIRDCSRSAHE